MTETSRFRNYSNLPRLNGTLPTDPKVSCDRAIRYSGFFGVRETWVLLEISGKHGTQSHGGGLVQMIFRISIGWSFRFQPLMFQGVSWEFVKSRVAKGPPPQLPQRGATTSGPLPGSSEIFRFAARALQLCLFWHPQVPAWSVTAKQYTQLHAA